MKLSLIQLSPEWVLVKQLKIKTWVQVQYNPVDETTGEVIAEEELQSKPLEELEKEEHKVEEIKTEIIGNFQKVEVVAIGSGQTALNLKIGDIGLIKYGSGEEFQWVPNTRLLQKHQIIAKISK